MARGKKRGSCRGGGRQGGLYKSTSPPQSARVATEAPPLASECWLTVTSFAQAEALRQLGEAQRTVRPTALHGRAARGHCLLFIRLTKLRTTTDDGRASSSRGDEGVRREGAQAGGGS